MAEDSCLTKRLSAFIDLTAAERAYLADIEEDSRHLEKGDPLPIAEAPGKVGVLDQGWAVAVTETARGERITHVFLPGEIVGLAEIGGTFRGQSLRMQTAGMVCPFARSEIGRALKDLPRLAALFLAISGIDQMTLRDRLAFASSLEAEDRLILLLLDLRARLALPNVGSGNRFRLPLTQVEIGRVIGASDITVNKAMQGLLRRGWLEHERPYHRLLDRDAMERKVHYVDRYAQIDTSWFPPAV